jgi:hypothetical protein
MVEDCRYSIAIVGCIFRGVALLPYEIDWVKRLHHHVWCPWLHVYIGALSLTKGKYIKEILPLVIDWGYNINQSNLANQSPRITTRLVTHDSRLHA